MDPNSRRKHSTYIPHLLALPTILALTISCTSRPLSERPAQKTREPDAINFAGIKSPIMLRGDATTAYRNPAAVYYHGTFYLYYSYIRHESDGRPYFYTALSKSRDLVHWTMPNILTPRDLNLNFSAPGNIIRFGNQWVLCLQSYPTPHGEKYGNRDARLWIMRSTDLENWSTPKMLMVKGPNVPAEEMGRLIDPYLIEDKDEPGRWWCFFDDNAANMSFSYDLKHWTYFNRIQAGENVCILIDRDEYLMFHSPRNGIAMKRSKDLKTWWDVGRPVTKDAAGPVTLGQEHWPWARGRLTAAFVMDLRNEPPVRKYIMFFHGTGPQDETVIFNTHACIGLAWSDDLETWHWPPGDAQ